MKSPQLASLITGWVSVLNKRIIDYSSERNDVNRKVVIDAIHNVKRFVNMMEQAIYDEEEEYEKSNIGVAPNRGVYPVDSDTCKS